MLLEILLASLITAKTTQKIEVKNGVDSQQLNGYIFPRRDNSVLSFSPGDSLEQIEAKRRLAAETLYQRSNGSLTTYVRGSSYTGETGEVTIIGYSQEQCVIYFKRQTGFQGSLGYAGNITPNSQTPQIGSGALEKGHISLVIAIGDGWVRVRETNWIRGAITERLIPMNYIRGYLII